jgi:L-rhamnose isomerase
MSIESAYDLAKKRYADLGVNTDKVLDRLSQMSISLHCWQADDVSGFEHPDASLSGGGIQATGNHFGKARTMAQMRQDMEKVYSLIPGKHRYSLHAIYGDFGGKFIDRDAIGPEHFQSWLDWAKNMGIKLDFNATLFSHPKAASGFTLSDKSAEIREFWINHVQRCREISAALGKAQGGPCIHNLWIPDGSKDHPVSRFKHRKLLIESLDTIFKKDYASTAMKDAIEGKLFGIGSEAFVVGSNDFYLGYAVKNHKVLTLDMGHYHPTESIADKISALLPFCPELLLHVSRGIRWDSDHVVIYNDELKDLFLEINRANAFDRVYLALDYFDASINRIGAYVTGTRATLKAILTAFLEPTQMLQEIENNGDDFHRLALLEELKSMPIGAVWDYYCLKQGVPVGLDWIEQVRRYEKDILSKR